METIIQGSDEWFNVRLGKVTASRVVDVIATVKSGEATSRRNYRIQLVCERLTGLKEETYTNHHMERGVRLEPIARALYEAQNDVFVTEIGFIHHPTIEMAGASPDGMLPDGQIEIKCPTAANHIETILGGGSPSKYYPQMQFQMSCTGHQWCDFISYCPDVGDDLALYVCRVPRDDAYIAEMEAAIMAFLDEVNNLYNQLKGNK
jgi:putative phage-type endonuclease